MVENVVILAGGSGTRLWPASVQACPKQFLDPGTGQSLLLMTVERAAEISSGGGSIVIVTHNTQVPGILTECLKLGRLRERIVILPEPQMRNTAPALGFAVAYLKDVGAFEETTVVLAADHLITPIEAFREAVGKATELARQDHLVTFGIVPTRPETGYGYIEAGDALPPGRRVNAFKEKPDSETARSYVAAGNYLWNSGMFVFKNSVLTAELEQYQPEIVESFSRIETLPFEERRTKLPLVNHEGITVAWKSGFLDQLYAKLPKISIDYAVMERSTRAAVVEADFTWNDIGSWDEMAQLLRDGVVKPQDGNALTPGDGKAAPVIQIESSTNYVYSELPVAICGVNDVSVIVKNGRVLVLGRERGQLVKEAVETMKEQGRDELV